jgi:cold shock CspA family protein
MTGRIKSLSTLSPSGFIRADNGQNFYFRSSAVLPPGVLATGQLVTFDLDEGEWPSAINVRVRSEQRAEAVEADRPRAGAYLQYLGFQQTGNTRTYRFRKISRGEPARDFSVNADLALFVKHRVGIQDGPALCLRLLSTGAALPAAEEWPSSQSLSDADMTAHLARRPVKGPNHTAKENPAR